MATVATFRNDFPEFLSSTQYTDPQITFWLGIGNKLLSAQAWGELLDHGLELFVAHHMTMGQQNAASTANGAAPGQNTGVVTAKAVDKVSVTYDASVGIFENAGHYNLTTYGLQFMQLARMIGAGGVQINGCGGIGVFPIWSVQ